MNDETEPRLFIMMFLPDRPMTTYETELMTPHHYGCVLWEALTVDPPPPHEQEGT